MFLLYSIKIPIDENLKLNIQVNIMIFLITSVGYILFLSGIFREKIKTRKLVKCLIGYHLGPSLWLGFAVFMRPFSPLIFTYAIYFHIIIFSIFFIEYYRNKDTPYGNAFFKDLSSYINHLKNPTGEIGTLDRSPEAFYQDLPYAYVLGLGKKWVKHYEEQDYFNYGEFYGIDILDGQVSAKEAYKIFERLCKGLDYAYRMGVESIGYMRIGIPRDFKKSSQYYIIRTRIGGRSLRNKFRRIGRIR